MNNDVLQRVIKVLAKIVDDDSIVVTKDSDLIDDLGLSSLDVFLVISDVEDEFDFEVPDKYLKRLVTVEDVANVVEQILNDNK